MLCGCGTGSANRAGGSAQDTPSVYSFPPRDALAGLRAQPVPERVLTELHPSAVAWEEIEALPEISAPTRHETTTSLGRLLSTLSETVPDLQATEAAACFAREVAHMQLETGTYGDEGWQRYVASRCGVPSPRFELDAMTVGNIPEEADDATLWVHARADIRSWLVSKLGATVETSEATEDDASVDAHAEETTSEAEHVSADTETGDIAETPPTPLQAATEGTVRVGAHLARAGDRAAVVLVRERPVVALDHVRPAPDDAHRVIVRGRLLGDAIAVVAFLNQGDFGVVRCDSDPRARLPEFTIVCPMAPADTQASLDILGLERGRFLADPLAMLLARRDADAARRYTPPDVGGPLTANDPAELTRGLLERVNMVRSRGQMPPLRHAIAETAAITAAAPHFFASETGDDIRDLVALTAMAGWEVDGVIQDASVASFVAPGNDVPTWLSFALDRPMIRQSLLDPRAAQLAVGPVVEDGAIGALVCTYRMFDTQTARLEDMASSVLDHITRARVSRGLEAPMEIEDASAIARELDRVRTEDKAPRQALRAALAHAQQAWGRSVEGFLVSLGPQVERLEIPEPLLRPGPLALQAAATYHLADGAPWGQYLVAVVVAR